MINIRGSLRDCDSEDSSGHDEHRESETQSYRLLRAAAHRARRRRHPGSVNRGRLHQGVCRSCGNDIRFHPMSVTPTPSLTEPQAGRVRVCAGNFSHPQNGTVIYRSTHASIDPPPVGRRRALPPGHGTPTAIGASYAGTPAPCCRERSGESHEKLGGGAPSVGQRFC